MLERQAWNFWYFLSKHDFQHNQCNKNGKNKALFKFQSKLWIEQNKNNDI